MSYAAKHKVPVVTDTWLYSSLANARKMSLSDHLVTGRPKQTLNHHPLDRPSSREASVAHPQEKR
jgi:hypothetical protein